MELTILIVSVTILVVILYFLSFKTEKHKQLFSNIASFVQTIAAVWAIWYSVSESKDNSKQFTEQLENQKKQIEQQDKQIQLQDQQIVKQTFIDSIMINELKSISGSSNTLKANVEIINSMVARMPIQIENINNGFMKIIEFNEVQLENQKRDFSREANILIEEIICERENIAPKYHIKGIKLYNSGDIDGSVYKITLRLPKKSIMEEKIWNTERPIGDESIVKIIGDFMEIYLTYNNLQIDQMKPAIANCYFQFYYSNENIPIEYVIESYSKFKGYKITTGNILINCKVIN